MTDFKKGLLLGIGMVVVFGTFVASTKSKNKYEVVEYDDKKNTYHLLRKDLPQSKG